MRFRIERESSHQRSEVYPRSTSASWKRVIVFRLHEQPSRAFELVASSFPPTEPLWSRILFSSLNWFSSSMLWYIWIPLSDVPKAQPDLDSDSMSVGWRSPRESRRGLARPCRNLPRRSRSPAALRFHILGSHLLRNPVLAHLSRPQAWPRKRPPPERHLRQPVPQAIVDSSQMSSVPRPEHQF